MPLVLAIKNRNAIVVASDSEDTNTILTTHFGQLIDLPGRCVIMLAGNLSAVRHTFEQTILPKIEASHSAAAVAQLVHAGLVLEVVPHLSELTGRVEIIVAGIDPIRHVEEPGLYYMDSAQEFNLEVVRGDAVAAGTTAAVNSLVAGHSYADSQVEQLRVLAKECLTATKLRWPTMVSNHMKIGVITLQNSRFQAY